jgi:hypothetical protein
MWQPFHAMMGVLRVMHMWQPFHAMMGVLRVMWDMAQIDNRSMR